MKPRGASLLANLDVTAGSCVSLIGAGGKTTTVLALAHEVRQLGWRVIVTTTTKIWPPPHMPVILAEDSLDAGDLASAFRREPVVALAASLGAEGKLHGLPPGAVCRMHAMALADLVMCEADGAAGRPLKSHQPGEPVVPACTTHLLVVAGLDALGRPVSDAAHRVERFCRVTGARLDGVVAAGHVAQALLAAARFAPETARVTYVLNKVDTASRADVDRVVRELRDLRPGSHILLTSRGAVVEAIVCHAVPASLDSA